ncbi:MAG: hypothetical protein AAF581_01290 [Planctomycetota bacterium]
MTPIVLALSVASLCCGVPVPDPQRVTLEEAAKSVREFVFKSEPKTNPAIEVTLEEITTKQTWKRLGVQVFKANKGHLYGRCYLFDRGTMLPMNSGWGSGGLDSIVVADLDHNGAAELYYTYSVGSGQSTAHLAYYESVQQRRFIDFLARAGALQETSIHKQGWLRVGARRGFVTLAWREMTPGSKSRTIGSLRAVARTKEDASGGAASRTQPTFDLDLDPYEPNQEIFTDAIVRVEALEDGSHAVLFRRSARSYRVEDAALLGKAKELVERKAKVKVTVDLTGFPRKKSAAAAKRAGKGALIIGLEQIGS